MKNLQLNRINFILILTTLLSCTGESPLSLRDINSIFLKLLREEGLAHERRRCLTDENEELYLDFVVIDSVFSVHIRDSKLLDSFHDKSSIVWNKEEIEILSNWRSVDIDAIEKYNAFSCPELVFGFSEILMNSNKRMAYIQLRKFGNSGGLYGYLFELGPKSNKWKLRMKEIVYTV